MTDHQQAAAKPPPPCCALPATGLPSHAQALDAEQVFAEAQLALPLWELRPDHARWTRAELSLRQLHDRLRECHGRRNLSTLTAAVAHAHALVSLGKPGRVKDKLGPVMADIVERCGRQHPIHLQATFLLGQAHAQLGDYERARDFYRAAFDGQSATLGASHPQTLETQFELGVALEMTGDGRQAENMFQAVRRAAPSSVGARTDLYARAVFASALTKLPTWLWARLARPRTHDNPSRIPRPNTRMINLPADLPDFMPFDRDQRASGVDHDRSSGPAKPPPATPPTVKPRFGPVFIFRPYGLPE